MSELKIFNVVNEGSKARLVPLSTKCEEYEGWPNRETWAVNLLRDVGSEWRVDWTYIAEHWIADVKEHLDA